jgi:hypothetical protein
MFPCAAKPGACDPAGPVEALGAGVRRARRLGVDDAELALVAALVAGGQPLDRLRGGAALAQQREPRRAVARVRVRLGRDRPTCGSAHGTTEPTARNFDCVATPHCPRSRSQAAIE